VFPISKSENVPEQRSLAAAFDRAGYAALSDMRSSGYTELFAQLEGVQSEFLAQVATFRDPGYHWGEDTLHTWARAWEYPYAAYHAARIHAATPGPLVVADFGSGSTYFPFAIARLGAEVICLDNDAMCVRDLQAAAGAVTAGSGRVEVRLSGDVLPVDTASVDLAYSVSVLEHMPNPVPVVSEIARIVRPGGLFVLTMDIDVEGAAGVAAAHFDALRRDLAAFFDWEFPERTIHPQDVLTSRTSPWPRPGERHVRGLLLRTPDRRLVPLIGGPSPGVLSVYACALRRRS
jgi:SAM-dependent methyltransferase